MKIQSSKCNLQIKQHVSNVAQKNKKQTQKNKKNNQKNKTKQKQTTANVLHIWIVPIQVGWLQYHRLVQMNHAREVGSFHFDRVTAEAPAPSSAKSSGPVSLHWVRARTSSEGIWTLSWVCLKDMIAHGLMKFLHRSLAAVDSVIKDLPISQIISPNLRSGGGGTTGTTTSAAAIQLV